MQIDAQQVRVAARVQFEKKGTAVDS